MEWSYLIKKYDSAHNITDSFTQDITLTADTVIDKRRWYRTSIEPNLWQTNHTDGLRIRKYVKDNPVVEWLEAKYPGVKDYLWQKASAQSSILSIDTMVTKYTGSYNCYLYKDISSDGTHWFYNYRFFNPKTGLIYAELYQEDIPGNPYLISTTELIRFKNVVIY